jgi:hypothetical protein
MSVLGCLLITALANFHSSPMSELEVFLFNLKKGKKGESIMQR